jgi:hypothetical protein
MPCDCFKFLCEMIKYNVGEDTFKSEAYLSELQDKLVDHGSRRSGMGRMCRCHDIHTGGVISGEMKLAITLQMLARGSYLNLSLIFGTGTTYP